MEAEHAVLCPALSCRSSARLPRGGDSVAQASALSQPSCCNTLTRDLCFVQVSRSAFQRGAVSQPGEQNLPRKRAVHKIFSRGCAPHPLSLKTRFSLYNIKVKVLQL